MFFKAGEGDELSRSLAISITFNKKFSGQFKVVLVLLTQKMCSFKRLLILSLGQQSRENHDKANKNLWREKYKH